MPASETNATSRRPEAGRRGTASVATTVVGIAALAALAGTVGLGLGLPATREQGIYARLIAIHPPLAWVAYLSFGVTAVCSALWLWRRTRAARWDLAAGASAEIAVVFTALTLATGSIWGRPTWGVWWTWDARLTLSALMFFLLLGYLALRRVPADREVRARRAAVAALAAVVVIPINHMAVEWWQTLHQGRSLAQPDPASQLEGAFIGAMLLGLLAMTLVYAWLMIHRFRIARLEDGLELDDVALAIADRRAEGGADPAPAPGAIAGPDHPTAPDQGEALTR
jgi:heme exporter protein C